MDENQYEKVIKRLRKENQFKENLLGISQLVVNIQERNELFKVIFSRIKSIFPFDECGLFVVDETLNQHYELTDSNTLDSSPAQVFIEDLFGKNALYEHKGTSVAWLMANGPIALSMEELDAVATHPQHGLMMERGLKQIIGGPLKKGSMAYGMLCFTSKKENLFSRNKYPLFQAISHQLSIAVGNILADEELRKERAQKEVLLQISLAATQLWNFRTFLKRFFEILRLHFDFYDGGVIIIDEERNLCRDLTIEIPDISPSEGNKILHGILPEEVPFEGSFYQWWLRRCEAANSPTKCTTDEMLDNFPDYYQNDTTVKIGYKEGIAAPMRDGGKLVGMLAIHALKNDHFKPRMFPFFQAVADQLGIALNNLLSRAELQLREKEKALQIQVVNALNEGQDWNKKLLGVARVFEMYFPFHLVAMEIVDGLMSYPNIGFERIGSDKYHTIDIAAFLRVRALEKDQQTLNRNFKEPAIFNGSDFEKVVEKSGVEKKIAEIFKVKSLMIVPIDLSGKRKLYISFYGKQPGAWRFDHKILLTQIVPSFQLALEKHLAYEEIRQLNEKLKEEKSYLQEELHSGKSFDNIIGDSPVMQRVFKQIHEVAPLDTPVLIQGETGTGKELVARAIHENSPRKDRLLVKVNCAAIPKDLVESELFGHVKGAFTGAIKDRIGKFELAHKGTIFLDEIGELPLALQAKLLRIIQEKELERIGGNRVIKLDFRLIVATNRNLQEETHKGTFRTDLFYRLHIFPIYIPPLHLRGNDILQIAHETARMFAHTLGVVFRGFTKESEQKLLSYHWPGNVRELQSLVQQAMITNRHDKLNLQPGNVETAPSVDLPKANLKQGFAISKNELEDISMTEIKRKKELLEKEYLEAVLQKTKWRVSGRHGAATLLDVNASTLENRLKKLGLRRK